MGNRALRADTGERGRKMEAYRSFAEVYDLFMDNVPYDAWRDHLILLLERYGVPRGLVAELGCGTGKMTRRLAAAGYDMIGIDNSYDMLNIAMEQETETVGDGAKETPDILYLCQDMRSFELFGTVAAVVSVCDSMNYITEEAELTEVFLLVNNYLDPGGIFVFDMNTPFKYRTLLGDNVFAENRSQGSFIWENYFDGESGINQYDLTLYIRREGDDGQEEAEEVYDRYEETHIQRAYEPDMVTDCLRKAGLEFLEMLDAEDLGEVKETTERVYFIARERGK